MSVTSYIGGEAISVFYTMHRLCDGSLQISKNDKYYLSQEFYLYSEVKEYILLRLTVFNLNTDQSFKG